MKNRIVFLMLGLVLGAALAFGVERVPEQDLVNLKSENVLASTDQDVEVIKFELVKRYKLYAVGPVADLRFDLLPYPQPGHIPRQEGTIKEVKPKSRSPGFTNTKSLS